ncbi:DUF805 domain-containing protein [Methylobacterium gossipiicola]|uniref:Uncharacterized membrane protein YhaH, DUF805 family n=1 Tax=Methylobacterium gossipiicola TaxID=582675 RepID=A0A1I2W6R5_9HYPH|nr:DUF805 domain-containing protein [Methylobacterium gossipiicola]SFG97074.1 Uncharacterized membrane protein YhaH, DUF805 family [Methylobacterium gossipiicola]
MRIATGLRRVGHALDPRGRMSARAYRAFVVRGLLYGAGLLCLAIWLAASSARGPAIAVVTALPILGLVVLAATARRLHDRDRSAGWLVAWGFVQALGFAPLERWVDTRPILVLNALLAMLGFSAWFVVETLLRAGTPGPNRFGPPPPG